jgi:hypothetical protein
MFKYTVFSSALILFSSLPGFAQSTPSAISDRPSQASLTNTIVGAVNNSNASNCIPLSFDPRFEGYSVGNISIKAVPGSQSVAGTQTQVNCQPTKVRMMMFDVNILTNERQPKHKKK